MKNRLLPVICGTLAAAACAQLPLPSAGTPSATRTVEVRNVSNSPLSISAIDGHSGSRLVGELAPGGRQSVPFATGASSPPLIRAEIAPPGPKHFASCSKPKAISTGWSVDCALSGAP